MAVSSSSSAPLRGQPKTSSPSCCKKEAANFWGGSQSLTATLHRLWMQQPTMQSQALTRHSAPSTSSTTHREPTSRRLSDEGKCGPLPQPGSSTALQPSASSLCLSIKLLFFFSFFYSLWLTFLLDFTHWMVFNLWCIGCFLSQITNSFAN